MVKRRTAEWRRASGDRVRVLIEDPGADWFHDFERYRCSGMEVAVCTGPDDAQEACPHLKGKRCDLWDEADVIVFALARDEPAGRLVLKSGRRDHPGKPIVFDLSTGTESDVDVENRRTDRPTDEEMIDLRVTAIRAAVSAARNP